MKVKIVSSKALINHNWPSPTIMAGAEQRSCLEDMISILEIISSRPALFYFYLFIYVTSCQWLNKEVLS
jgi:hypothetical protein